MTSSHPIIVTHGGKFHADEIMAVVLLARYCLVQPCRVSIDDPTATVMAWLRGTQRPTAAGHWDPSGLEDLRTPCMVVRTRDNTLLKEARNQPHAFVVDVGGELNRKRLNFDHHQASMTETWPDGTPLSSTGLVWLWLKAEGYLDSMDPGVQQELEQSTIRPLDAHDNGVTLSNMATLCDTYNRTGDDHCLQNEQFTKALAFLTDVFENMLNDAIVKLEAVRGLERAWALSQRRGDRHVLLPERLTYTDCTTLLKQISNDEAELLIVPGQGNRFSIISLALDEPFSTKCPCPEAWRGRMDEKVDIEGRSITLAFAHKNGFMCVVEGDGEDAQAIARHIIQWNDERRPKRALRA